MTFITETAYTTETGLLSFSPTATVEKTVTITTEYEETYTATLGQTVTILPHWPILTTFTPSVSGSSSPILSTLTITDIVVILQDSQHNPFSTQTVALSAADSHDPGQTQPSPYLYVVQAGQDTSTGWDCWSSSQKGGLIAGVVVVFLLLVALVVFWMAKRRKMYIENSWNVRNYHDSGLTGYHPGWPTVYTHPGIYTPVHAIT